LEIIGARREGYTPSTRGISRSQAPGDYLRPYFAVSVAEPSALL